MGFNVGIVHIAGAGLEDLPRLGLSLAGQQVSGDEALIGRDGSVSARAVRGGLLLVDGGLGLAAEDAWLAAELDRRVVAVLLGSTSDTYSFAMSGPDQERRHIVDSQGERVVDEGESLPQDDGIACLDEDSTLGLLEELAGVVLDEALMLAMFEQVLGGDSAGLSSAGPASAPPIEVTSREDATQRGTGRRGFFARLLGR